MRKTTAKLSLMKPTPLGLLKRLYASMARSVGTLLRRLGFLREPPPLGRRFRHWAHTLTLVHDPAALAGLDIPWWTYRAIDRIESWLSARNTTSAFEWGAGASTVWLARRVDRLISVDHSAQFFDSTMASVAGFHNVRLLLVEAEPSPRPTVPSSKEGFKNLDFGRYVTQMTREGGLFDLIVIDGRAREACLEVAKGHLAPDGIIVFDNSRRRRYRAAISSSGLVEELYRGLTPTLPYPEQTSILRRGR